MAHTHRRLGTLVSTAICGNDIFSTVLYVSGVVALVAGVYAPFIFLAVAGVVILYQRVHREVIEALPLNGGAYNALLNATSKIYAAFAGIMMVLSYITTAVISSHTAIEYALTWADRLPLFSGPSHLPALWLTAGLLTIFCLLTIRGLHETARVATTIFFVHLITLVIFAISAIFLIIQGTGDVLLANARDTHSLIAQQGGWFPMLFFAFSLGLLGVTGFESSSNFIEQQKPGVYKTTLRVMTIGTMIINPLIAWIVIRILPLGHISRSNDFLLADAANAVGGTWLFTLISWDAVLVLSGAAISSFIGMSGLLRRMSLDGCLPTFFHHENSQRVPVRAVIGCLLLCLFILVITQGDLFALAGVYTLNFLCVMSLFAIANLTLRRTRPDLKRPYKATFITVALALLLTLGGLLGNALLHPEYLGLFLLLFFPGAALILLVLHKRAIWQWIFRATWWLPPLAAYADKKYQHATRVELYVFLHKATNIFRALMYIATNETSHDITIVHCKHEDPKQRDLIKKLLPGLVKAGVFPHLRVRFEYVPAPFSPELVKTYTKRKHIPANQVFIGSIHSHDDYNYQDFGGVRIIL